MGQSFSCRNERYVYIYCSAYLYVKVTCLPQDGAPENRLAIAAWHGQHTINVQLNDKEAAAMLPHFPPAAGKAAEGEETVVSEVDMEEGAPVVDVPEVVPE
jgi:hypothetical protein